MTQKLILTKLKSNLGSNKKKFTRVALDQITSGLISEKCLKEQALHISLQILMPLTTSLHFYHLYIVGKQCTTANSIFSGYQNKTKWILPDTSMSRTPVLFVYLSSDQSNLLYLSQSTPSHNDSQVYLPVPPYYKSNK